MSSVEKLMPGAMTDSARQNPQNRYQPKLGAIVTREQAERDKQRQNHRKRSAQADPAARRAALLAPASRNSEGSMPVISPINRQTEGSG